VVIDSTTGAIAKLSPHGTHRYEANEFLMNERARVALAWWLKVRRELEFPQAADRERNEWAAFVFPSNREGAPLDRDSMAIAVRKEFGELGIDVQGAPVQCLRTEFAKANLGALVDAEKVASHMAMFDARSLEPYTRLITRPPLPRSRVIPQHTLRDQ
jgi:hypothetical protein